MIKVASKEQFVQLINDLAGEYKIAAPVRKQKGKKERVDFAYIDSPEEIFLARRPDSSPKGFFLPQNESMVEGEVRQDNKTILLGVRSCDLETLKVMDDVYLTGDFVDGYYRQHRQNTVVVGLSCNKGEAACFCQALGIDPVENEKAPLYLYQDGERFFIQVNEDYQAPAAGSSDLLAGLIRALEGLTEVDEEEFTGFQEKRKADFPDQDYELDLPIPLPEEAIFKAPFWDEIAEKCLGCGSCTFYCPSCYCFGFFWDGEEKKRGWDSCMFAAYTKHASGHNPRNSKEQRYRQRLMHKYSYHPQNYQGLACTGCGRCIANCPVNLDIRTALKTVEAYLKEEGGVEHG